MILKRMDIIRTVVISAALGYASCQSVYQAFMDTSRRGYNIVFAIIAIVAEELLLLWTDFIFEISGIIINNVLY